VNHLERLKMMADPLNPTWDLSDNDIDAIRWILSQLDASRAAYRLESEAEAAEQRRRIAAESRIETLQAELDELKKSRCDSCPVHPSIAGVEALKAELDALRQSIADAPEVQTRHTCNIGQIWYGLPETEPGESRRFKLVQVDQEAQP